MTGEGNQGRRVTDMEVLDDLMVLPPEIRDDIMVMIHAAAEAELQKKRMMFHLVR